MRDNNNVTWRNFNVVSTAPAAPSGITVNFDMAGAWDRARAMRFEVVAAELPDEASIRLQVPLKEEDVLRGFATLGAIERDSIKQIARARLRLDATGCSRGESIQLRKKFRAKNCQLQINIPQQLLNERREIYIRQLFEEVEVGRITWQLIRRE